MAHPFDIYSGQRVLITGHTGFKGSWLSLWLSELGAEVHGVALDPLTQPNLFTEASLADIVKDNRCDIRAYDDLQKTCEGIQPSIIFHLAAQPLVRSSYETARETFETNVMGSVHVFEVARYLSSVKALVHVSTDKCYRESQVATAYHEEDALGGRDPYSASKAAAEIAFNSYRMSFFDDARHLPAASGRAGNVIGGGDWSVDRLVPDAARAWHQSQPLAVRNPSSVRPWQHVLEALSGYLTLGASLLANRVEARGAWNFGPADESVHTVKELVDEMSSAWGERTWHAAADEGAPHEAVHLSLSCEKAASMLGWHPRWGFQETVERTVTWYTSYYDGQAANELCLADIRAYMGSG